MRQLADARREPHAPAPGLDPSRRRPVVVCLNPLAMIESPLIKRLLWSGLLAGTGALATRVATRVAAVIWMRVFGEEPPE